MTRAVWRAAIAAAAVLGFAGTANAGLIYYTGFEAPLYTTGALAGQNGWNVFGTSGAVTVQDLVAASGDQAVQVNGAGVAGQTGPWRANANPNDNISLAADIMITSSSAQRGWQFAALGPGLIGFAGGINFSSGGNIFAISASGNNNIGTYNRDVFNRVELLLHYGSQTFDVNLNGANLATGLAFCGENFSCMGTVIPEYRTALFDTFGTGGNDFGYLDNVTITAVPEPSTWAMLIAGFGAAGALLRRRRTLAVA